MMSTAVSKKSFCIFFKSEQFLQKIYQNSILLLFCFKYIGTISVIAFKNLRGKRRVLIVI